MYKLLLFASLSLAVFSTSATKIINDEHVTKETDCFTGIFADYASWHQFIAQKNKLKAKTIELGDELRSVLDFESTDMDHIGSRFFKTVYKNPHRLGAMVREDQVDDSIE